jgi:uncharacterized protein (TIGR03435 family)
MTKTLSVTTQLISTILLPFYLTCAQPSLAGPAFEAAVVKINTSDRGLRGARLLPGGEFTFTNVTLRELTMWAYHVRIQAVKGGPSWLDTDRFDVIAKAPPKTPINDARLMLQTLLSEHFRLMVHDKDTITPVYALVIGKTRPILVPSTRSDPSHCGRSPGTVLDGQNHIKCTNLTLAEFAEYLPDLAPQYMDRPVIDLTGLAGTYDFDFHYARLEQSRQGPLADQTGGVNTITPGPTVFDALEKQLGLRLEQRRRPMPMIVIDHSERAPLEKR